MQLSQTSQYQNTDRDEKVPTIASEQFEYTSLHEVMTEVRDVCILDLTNYVHTLPISYQSKLLPCPPGVYLYGGLNPIATPSPATPLYSRTQFEKDRRFPDIISFDDFIQCKDTVVDLHGNVVCRTPYSLRRQFQSRCSFEYSAIYLAAIAAWECLSHIHRDTNPITNIGMRALDVRNYILPDIDPNTFRPDEHPGVQALLNDIYKFVGRDLCATYNLRFKNATLYLEKGNDYRVIEYYRQIFDAFEERVIADYGF